MTDKLKEYVDNLYPIPLGWAEEMEWLQNKMKSKQVGFIDGFALGTEFAEWIDDEGYRRSGKGNGKWYHYPAKEPIEYFTTPELTELFIDYKMKEK